MSKMSELAIDEMNKQKEREKKYIEGEKFFEITFDLPAIYNKDKLADEIMNYFKYAVNIKIIPCNIFVDSPRLSVSRDNYSYTVYNSKQKSQIIDKEVKP